MGSGKKFWNRQAKRFEKRDNPSSDIRKSTYADIRKHLHPEDEILEYGCATGSLTIELSEDVKHIKAVDISDKMIKIAAEKIKEKGITNVEFEVASISVPSPIERKYDVILAFYILHLLPDLNMALGEMKRRLKPGGLVIAEAPCLSEMGWWKKWMLKLGTRIAGLPYIAEFDQDDLKKSFKNFGFEIIEFKLKTEKFPRTFIVAKSPDK